MKSLTAVLMIALVVLAPTALASEPTFHTEDGNAITICRGALPAYETLLRSRPLAIVNEGVRSSYVNCGWRAPTSSKGQTFFSVVLVNLTNAGVAVPCTGVIGTEDGTATYHARQAAVPANGYATVTWEGEIDTNTSAQCLLPPGVGIARTPQGYWQQ